MLLDKFLFWFWPSWFFFSTMWFSFILAVEPNGVNVSLAYFNAASCCIWIGYNLRKNEQASDDGSGGGA